MAEFFSGYSFCGCLVLNTLKVSPTYSPWEMPKRIFLLSPTPYTCSTHCTYTSIHYNTNLCLCTVDSPKWDAEQQACAMQVLPLLYVFLSNISSLAKSCVDYEIFYEGGVIGLAALASRAGACARCRDCMVTSTGLNNYCLFTLHYEPDF